jgi:hypothetical protein
MEIFQKRRQAERVRPGPQAGLLWRWGLRSKDLAPPTPEAQEQANAERGARLSAFVKGEPVQNIWADDLEPEFRRFRDTLVEDILTLEPAAPGATEKLWQLTGELRALTKWANSIDAAINLGAGDLERMALRQLRQAVAAESSNKETATK